VFSRITLAESSSSFPLRLHVFTSGNISISIDLNNNPANLSDICNKTKPLYKFIVHGFYEEWNMTFRWNWVNDLKNEMLKSKNADSLCVIALDWKELAKGDHLIANYWKAISNMHIAADMLTLYLNVEQVKNKHVHCIGFSLGAHMCGVFYKHFSKQYNYTLDRITGLDPAGPFFQNAKPYDKLVPTDARFVDVIHTSNQFGIVEKSGHMDFYPDEGPSKISACDFHNYKFEKVIIYEEKNPKNKDYEDITLANEDIINGRLGNLTIESVSKTIKSAFKNFMSFFFKKPARIFTQVHQFLGCAHLMAMRYFIHSINRCTYQVSYCNNSNILINNTCDHFNTYKLNSEQPRMGFYADLASDLFKKSYGNFYLNTTPQAPYCRNETLTEL